MKLRALVALAFLTAYVAHAAEDDSDIRTHCSVVVSNLIVQSDAIICGTLADGIMGESDKDGDSIFFVYVNVTDVLKAPSPPESDRSDTWAAAPAAVDPFAAPGQPPASPATIQDPPYPYDQFVEGQNLQILWYTQEAGGTDDKVSLPRKSGEKGVFFLRVRGNSIVNTDRWFSYHPENSKLVEEIRRRTKPSTGTK